LKKNNIKRTITHLDLIGCSIEVLKNHLEVKFIDEMSFFNYGDWEVDHIYPLSKFDLTKVDQIKKAFNYINLQPLWYKENRSKSNKILPQYIYIIKP
jgi:hypothetical protein